LHAKRGAGSTFKPARKGRASPPPGAKCRIRAMVRRLHLWLLAAVLAMLVWSGVAPRDRFTWFLEIAPVIAGVAVLAATYGRFRFTSLAYVLAAVQVAIMIVGGHWTYAENPLFNWIKEAWHLPRNYYDRLGHLAQGFVPAVFARELLLRTSPLRRGKWLSVIVVGLCLAASAAYEFVEWWVSLCYGEEAVAFLGTQGDVWDTQWDMFTAFIGAVLSLLTLRKLHDRQLARLNVD